ncbi:MAG: hypothetical protein WA825_08310 [Steroidobacteraceae bacterium]
MTFILAVNSQKTTWMLADRRLSVNDLPVKEDACKLMFLKTTDATAILGYAGLGATLNGNEPADWMSRVLRGRNLPLEHSLWVLAEAIKREMPRHLLRMSRKALPTHTVLVSAFVGGEARIYTIDMAFAPDRKHFWFRYTRHVNQAALHVQADLAIGGTGILPLSTDTAWQHPLRRLIHACDRDKVSPFTVADHLANLNAQVHGTVPSVGPHCIVAWRHKDGGGNQKFYSAVAQKVGRCAIPDISNGMDMRGFIEILAQHHHPTGFGYTRADGTVVPPPKGNLGADLAALPTQPDETLR